MSLLAFYPYRCGKCAHRFLRYRYSSGVRHGDLTPTEREIHTTRAAFKWKAKRRELILYGAGLLLIAVFLYFITRERSRSEGGLMRRSVSVSVTFQSGAPEPSVRVIEKVVPVCPWAKLRVCDLVIVMSLPPGPANYRLAGARKGNIVTVVSSEVAL